ncbi:MAG: hypothetical protein WDW38_003683 [Sanguina aurantia]
MLYQMFHWAAAPVLLCAVLAWYALYPDTRWKFRKIPGPVGLPFIGNLVGLATGMGLPDFAAKTAAQYGDVCKEAKGPSWRAARKPFEAELINASSLHRHLPNMDACSRKFCARLDLVAASGEVIDIHKELAKLTLSVVGESAYGVDFSTMGGSEQGQEFIEALKFEFRVAEVGKGSPYSILQLIFPAFSPLIRMAAGAFPDAVLRKHQTARRLIASVSKTLLAEWRAKQRAPADSTTADDSKEEGGLRANNFMASILRSNADGSGAMADVDIIAQTWSFILAGYETTANTLCMATYLLSVNPAAEARLMAEIDSLGDLTELDADSLDKMPYTDAVVKESLRLLGPAGSLLRASPEDFDLDGKGTIIPKDTIMMLATYTFHHDPKYWPRVQEFLPERFLPEGEATLGPSNPNAFLPFGIGSRSCPGYKFANMEAKIALVRMYQRFTFCLSPASQHPIKHRTGITLGPVNGLHVSVMHRKK